MYGGQERCYLRERNQLDDIDVNGRIIQKWIIKK
jgi:hypothetical protein